MSSSVRLSAEGQENFVMKNDTGVLRRLPVGAEPQPSGGVHFRVWAPDRKRGEVLLESVGSREPPASYELKRDAAGYFSGLILDAAPHMVYRYRLDGSNAYPDPASRFQPDGPH